MGRGLEPVFFQLGTLSHLWTQGWACWEPESDLGRTPGCLGTCSLNGHAHDGGHSMMMKAREGPGVWQSGV